MGKGKRDGSLTLQQKLTNEAVEMSKRYLESYAGRPATEEEIRRLTPRDNNQYEPVALTYQRVRAFLRELEARHAYACEGILRVSARNHAVRGLWALIPSEDFTLVRISNVHVIAASLKLYLREQVKFVIPAELYKDVVDSQRPDDETEQKEALKAVLMKLEVERRVILYHICLFCRKILQHSELNKMTVENISICLSPSLVASDTMDPISISEGAPYTKRAVMHLVSDLDYFFDADDIEQDMKRLPPDTSNSNLGFSGVHLEEDEWQRLLNSASVVSFAAGTDIIKENGKIGECYRIHSGTASIFTQGQKVGELMTLDVIGQEATIGVTKALDTVVASTAVRAYRIKLGSLENAFLIEPTLAQKWFISLSVQLALKVAWMEHLEAENSPLYQQSATDLDAVSERVFGGSGGGGGAGSTEGGSAVNNSPKPTKLSHSMSSTSTFGVKNYKAKLQVGNKKRSAILSITSDHLTYECKKNKSTSQLVAKFIPFQTISSVDKDSDLVLTVCHTPPGSKDGPEKSTFVFEQEAAAKDVHDILLRILGRILRNRSTSGASLDGVFNSDNEWVPRALVVEDYKASGAYDLDLKRNDLVTVIKRDVNEDMWYGEVEGKEGCFPRSSVVLTAPAVSKALMPTPSEWEILLNHANKLEHRKGDTIVAEGDVASRGFLYIVKKGTCFSDMSHGTLLKRSEMPFYMANDVFGELSFLLGLPSPATVSAWSDAVEVYQLDGREGSALSDLLNTRRNIAQRFFQYLACVCDRRATLLKQRLVEKQLREEAKRKGRLSKRPNHLLSQKRLSFQLPSRPKFGASTDEVGETEKPSVKFSDKQEVFVLEKEAPPAAVASATHSRSRVKKKKKKRRGHRSSKSVDWRAMDFKNSPKLARQMSGDVLPSIQARKKSLPSSTTSVPKQRKSPQQQKAAPAFDPFLAHSDEEQEDEK